MDPQGATPTAAQSTVTPSRSTWLCSSCVLIVLSDLANVLLRCPAETIAKFHPQNCTKAKDRNKKPIMKKPSQIRRKGFDTLTRWFFNVGNIFNHICTKSGRDVRGHLTTSLQAEVPRYVWTEEKAEYLLKVIREKNKTAIHDSEQTQRSITVVRFCTTKFVENSALRASQDSIETHAESHCTLSTFLTYCFYFAKNCNKNAANVVIWYRVIYISHLRAKSSSSFWPDNHKTLEIGSLSCFLSVLPNMIFMPQCLAFFSYQQSCSQNESSRFLLGESSS